MIERSWKPSAPRNTVLTVMMKSCRMEQSQTCSSHLLRKGVVPIPLVRLPRSSVLCTAAFAVRTAFAWSQTDITSDVPDAVL